MSSGITTQTWKIPGNIAISPIILFNQLISIKKSIKNIFFKYIDIGHSKGKGIAKRTGLT